MRASGLIRNTRQTCPRSFNRVADTVHCVCHKEEGTSSTLSQHCYRSEDIFDSCKNEETWISEFKGIREFIDLLFQMCIS